MSEPSLRVVGTEDMDKQKALDAALRQIDRAFGKGSIMRLGDSDKVVETEFIPTGSLALDIALGIGGLPRGRVVEIYGPEGIEELIAANIKIMNFGLSFPVLITPVNEGTIVSEEKYQVHACEAEHSVPTFSFLFEEKEKPGTFYPEKANSLGIPKGELWHKLQQGEEVVIENKSIKPSEVMGPNVSGKKVGISGDTRPTKKLEEFFKNCDYLVFDSTYLDELKEKAIQTCHSTAKEAATFAKNANVSNLILTHFSARYKDGNVLLEEAKTIHNSVIAANDQLKINIV